MSDIKVGDRVRKFARRGRPSSRVLGVVIELFELRGKEWARIASGEKREVTTAWPVKSLKRVEEEA